MLFKWSALCTPYISFRLHYTASGPAGPVLAGPVFTVIFETAHAQMMNMDDMFGAAHNLSSQRAYTPFCAELYLVPVPRHGHSNWQYH